MFTFHLQELIRQRREVLRFHQECSHHFSLSFPTPSTWGFPSSQEMKTHTSFLNVTSHHLEASPNDVFAERLRKRLRTDEEELAEARRALRSVKPGDSRLLNGGLEEEDSELILKKNKINIQTLLVPCQLLETSNVQTTLENRVVNII